MISQAILVLVMLLLDNGRCWESMPMHTCPTKRGDQAIPFPFHTSSGCKLDYYSLVTCNYSYNPPKLFSNLGSMDVPDVLHDTNLKVACDYDSGSQVNNSMSGDTLSKFSMSGTKNLSLGLDTYFVSGNRKILGYLVNLRGLSGQVRLSSSWKADSEISLLDRKIPLNNTLGWPVANISCHEAQKLASNFECRAPNSECVDSSSGAGYHCKCLTGFGGDPYHADGCHDIDECSVSEPCEGTCRNLIGSYSCSCPPRFEGDGKKDGSGCHPRPKTSRFIFYLGFVVPAFGISWIIWLRKQKKVVKLRRGLFIRNGGELLEAKQSIQKTLSIFTAEDLKKATNNYDENNVLCQEDHLGFTYKGLLARLNCCVTIQFCHAFDRCKIETLITKLVALSQISHRNVVKLLGCCLETQIPLVVYESITCKTLFDYINNDSLSWYIRLRIAADTAGALAYLHSAAIIHGNLNSSCILLDHVYTVKVKGFDLTCLECSCVQFRGYTSIYLDPDFFSSGQLTEKSDVYNFGFILVELLTGKDVTSPELLIEEEDLAKYFFGSSTEGDLLRILDDCIVTDDNVGKLRKVAEIAKICLSSSSHDRPTMKEVVIELECIILS